MTAGESVVIRVADALEAGSVAYVLSGSFASNYYGIPRSTKDADFVVQVPGALGEDFATRLGEDFVLDPQWSFETNTLTFRQPLRHRGRGFKVELFALSQDAHDQARFQRRRTAPLLGRHLWLPSPEDVIVTKLRWGRGKDKDDARDVMAVQARSLDWSYIRGWCSRHGTLALLEQIHESIPDLGGEP